jgi:hypothetical protein
MVMEPAIDAPKASGQHADPESSPSISGPPTLATEW